MPSLLPTQSPPLVSSPAPTTTFHKFPKRPPELRLMIWRLIANTPRTISISCTYLSFPERYIITNGMYTRNPDYHITGVKHNARTVPAILSVSQEARFIGLEHYDFFFSPAFLGQLGFYINYAVDTLLIWEDDVIDFFFAGLDASYASSLPDEILELEKKLKFLA